MKKFAVLASVLLICLLLPALALAMSQEEWNQKCRSKTSGTITLYDIEKEAEDGAASADPSARIREIGSLPGGTYIVIGGFDYDLRMYQVAYLKDGNVEAAWSPKESAIVSATTVVYFDDGAVADFPEALVADKDALLRHLKIVFPDRSYSLIEGSSVIHAEHSQPAPTRQPAKDTGTSGKIQSKSSGKGQKENAPSAMMGSDAVAIKRLGVATSTIVLGGETREIPTAGLSFGAGVPKEKEIAVIHAPNTGKCSLRDRGADSGKVLQKCKAGTVVSVLEVGDSYCKISYKGTVGYVQTPCLKFYGGEVETIGTGKLSYKGRATGGTTVNVRNAPEKGSAKIAEWKTGTQVTVFTYENGWYEIETQGIHGYVMDEFLLMEE